MLILFCFHSKPKLCRCKQLTLDMGDEIKEHNRLLNTMDNDAESVWGQLGGSMKRLKRIATAGHNRIYLYLLAFALFVFLLIYLILKTR